MFWMFQACGLFLYTAAQGLATVYDSILHKPLDQPWPSDLLFFLWMMPAFLSLFLDEKAKSQRIEWVRWLDYAQVGILVVSLHVFLFEVPSHWNIREFSFERMEFAATCIRNVALVALFAWRANRAREQQAKSLFGRMAIFLGAFSLAECSYLYLQVFERLRVASFWDLPWTVSMALGTVLIFASSPADIVAREEAPRTKKRERLYARAALKLVPLLLPDGGAVDGGAYCRAAICDRGDCGARVVCVFQCQDRADGAATSAVRCGAGRAERAAEVRV